mmetsp:Transcript_79036/g.154569  ORF Transcript_79036/g.154569 Transcript_79036/m.154569 type:complete len:650 (+) Transcript_79036:38-1987(+)
MRERSSRRRRTVDCSPNQLVFNVVLWLRRRGSMAFTVSLFAIILIQRMMFQHQISLLRDAGPIGFYLMRDRRWVMTPELASGKGRVMLLELEELSTEYTATSLPATLTNLSSDNERNSGSWGKRCWSSGQPHVLVAVPFNPTMPEMLQQTLSGILERLECGNPGLNLELALTSARPPKDPLDATGRGRIATIRNVLIKKCLLPRHDFVLWLDADLTVVPTDLVTRLHLANPKGISAPLVLLDSGAAHSRQHQSAADARSAHVNEGKRPSSDVVAATLRPPPFPPTPAALTRFYDTAAFVQEGQLVQRTSPPGKAPCGHRNYGSVTALPPYFNVSSSGSRKHSTSKGGLHALLSEEDYENLNERRVLRGQPPRARVIPCDSVGTTYLIPAKVYRWKAGGRSAQNQKPTESALPARAPPAATAAAAEGGVAAMTIRHYAHVLTEHCPVVHAAKYLLGLEVVAVPNVRVLHADLPVYGEAFHGNAFDRSRWPDLEGPGGYAGASLGDSRLVVKTLVELALRSQRGVDSSTGGTGSGNGGGRKDLRQGALHKLASRQSLQKGDVGRNPLTQTSGAEADHATVAACVSALCDMIGCEDSNWKLAASLRRSAPAEHPGELSSSRLPFEFNSPFAVAQRALLVLELGNGLASIGCL